MSDTTQHAAPEEFDDERDEGTPEKGNPEKEPGTILDLAANPPEQEGKGLTAAAALVPVEARGAAPANFAHQITIAQYMAKAQLMVPEHFHGNVGDCLAIIDISQRAGLSPYMVAAKTYKTPGGKGIAFESQLYHAFLIGSGCLEDKALHSSYEGEGGERTCKVWGTLKGERQPREYTTPPLKELHPGYTLAKQEGSTRSKKSISYQDGQALMADPEFKDTLYVAGSPLWDAKPDVQHFYDASRDWGRMFAPIATLGMLAQYESIEHPIAPPAGDSGDALRQRLANGDKSEGHQPGFAERELAQVASDAGTIKPAGKDEPAKPAQEKKPAKPAAKQPTKAEKRAQDAKAAAKGAADRAQASSDARKREAAEKNKAKPKEPAKAKPEQKTDDPPPAVPTKPKNAAEYQVYATDWISKGGDPEAAIARWDTERDMRDDFSVRLPARNMLRAEIEKKHGV